MHRWDRVVFSYAFYAGQINLERGATSFIALHHYVASALLHDTVYRREAEPGSLAFLFCGEERLKDSRLGLFIHSHAGIADRENYVVARANKGRPAAMTLVHDDFLRLEGERSAAGHRILGVYHKIHQHLLQLASIGPGVGRLGR